MKKGSPAMAIGYNEDLTTEILLRLPAKSVLRFKTVSKQWHSIVSSLRSRASGIGTATGLFLYKLYPLDENLEFLPLILDNQISPLPNIISLFNFPIQIRSSSGGLLLLMRTFNPFMCDRDYFVCNPTTREFKHLAVPQHIRYSQYVSETLAFDPSKSPHYKVVFLCNEFKIMIYSSKTATFRSLGTVYLNIYERGIFCNDAIHWISIHGFSFYYFDLNRECMNESPLPPGLADSMQYFGESRGHLHLITVDNTDPRNQLVIYELKRDYSGWSVKYHVDLASIAIPFPQKEIYSEIRTFNFTVLSILVDEEDDLTMVLLVCGMFVAYHIKKKICNVLRQDDRDRRYRSRPIAHHYIETLACV